MTTCGICLGKVARNGSYHPQCLELLFGTATIPRIDVELSTFYSLAATRMAGKMSISGAQEKVSLALSPDGQALDVVARGGRYILKPETPQFPAVPQNEHLSMRLAQLVSIEVPPVGLIRLKDGAEANIIQRFDRTQTGEKLAVEDFCQLAGKRLRDKYDGSAELCVRIVRRYATEPLIEIQKLYRLILFCWWIANGDMHLKNFSLITTRDGLRRVAPAYDLLCTRLVIPDDVLAMPVGGRDQNLTRRKWLDFATYCRIPERAATRILTAQARSLDSALRLVRDSFLPQRMKDQYAAILRANTAVLSG